MSYFDRAATSDAWLTYSDEFSQAELAVEGVLVGCLRANCLGELSLEDDFGSIRVIADEPSLLHYAMLGSMLVVRRFELVVEKLPYLETESERNPYVAESMREAERKKRRTLEKKLRYVRIEMASVSVAGRSGPATESSARLLQALLKPPSESAMKMKKKRKARICFLVSRVSEIELTTKGKARFVVKGFPIMDDITPLMAGSETLVTFVATCVICLKGQKCKKLHSTAVHALLHPGRTYSIPCHPVDDGTFLANYCDNLGGCIPLCCSLMDVRG